mmetsp:Transcript_87964/g.137797  ORF Transcript_87964/g.137797 Transcript_87964/m.137797 type:complete len:109 (+) Transcript_87964:60-386(+)
MQWPILLIHIVMIYSSPASTKYWIVFLQVILSRLLVGVTCGLQAMSTPTFFLYRPARFPVLVEQTRDSAGGRPPQKHKGLVRSNRFTRSRLASFLQGVVSIVPPPPWA